MCCMLRSDLRYPFHSLPCALPCPALQLAKEAGDFLLVGLHTDEDVEARRGPHTPIMNVHERALSVLACKYVDEVGAAITGRVHVCGTAAGVCGCPRCVLCGVLVQRMLGACTHLRGGCWWPVLPCVVVEAQPVAASLCCEHVVYIAS